MYGAQWLVGNTDVWNVNSALYITY